MEPERLRAVRALGATVVAMTFLLMIVGSWVKATGSGLSCPDWPQCYGEWLPPFPSADNGGTYQGEPVYYSQAQILYEWAHRGLAMMTGFVVLAFAALVLTKGKELHPAARALPVIAIMVLALQILIGGLTVLTGNPAWATTWHLATATLFFFLVTIAAAFLYLRPFPTTEHPAEAAPEVSEDAPEALWPVRFPGEDA